MWIRKLINRLNHRLSLRESQDPASFVYMRGRLECLDPKLFARLQLVSACITPVTVDLPTIRRYNQLFTSLLAQPLATTEIDFTSIGFQRLTTTVDAFFRDKRGHPLPAVEEVRTFKQQALTLLLRFEQLVQDENMVASNNARKMKTLLFSTAVLADQLRNYSLK